MKAHVVTIPFDFGVDDPELSKSYTILTWSKKIPTIAQILKVCDILTTKRLRKAVPIIPPDKSPVKDFYDIGYIRDGNKDWIITAQEVPVLQIED